MSARTGALSGLRRLAADTGLLSGAQRLFGGVGAILMLHRVRAPGWSADPGMFTAPETLRHLIVAVRRSGYDVVSLDEAVQRITGGGRRFCCLTFDDGYRDNHDVLWPVLRAEQAPATIYLTTGFVDGMHLPWRVSLESLVAARDALCIDGAVVRVVSAADKSTAYETLATELRTKPAPERSTLLNRWIAQQGLDSDAVCRSAFMDWKMVRAMASDPLVTFGAHTVSHPRLAELGDEPAAAEITNSRARIGSILGAPPRHFAFPFGLGRDSKPRDEHLAAAAGFTTAVHGFGGPLRRGARLHALSRIPFGGDDDDADLAVRLTGLGAALRSMRRMSSGRKAHAQ